MKPSKYLHRMVAVVVGSAAGALGGCNTVGSATADLGLAGAGGVAGYQVSGGKVGGAAAGAALGYVGSRVAQAAVENQMTDAEKRGYDRGMNQAVKQQYWLIQARQQEPAESPDAGLTPVVIPETKINGVVYNAHVEYLRVAR